MVDAKYKNNKKLDFLCGVDVSELLTPNPLGSYWYFYVQEFFHS